MQIDKLEKVFPETIQKLAKFDAGTTLTQELEWCWNSFKYDNNPVGLIEKSRAALVLLKEAKERNSRSVSSKLIENLEKGLNRV